MIEITFNIVILFWMLSIVFSLCFSLYGFVTRNKDMFIEGLMGSVILCFFGVITLPVLIILGIVKVFNISTNKWFKE